MSANPLTAPLSELPWIPPQRARQFERFGLVTMDDLLTHYPKRYEDRRTFDHFPHAESELPVCVCGMALGVAVKRLRGGRTMVEVTLEEEQASALSPRLICRWFNVYHVQKMIAAGHKLIVFGKPKERAGKLYIDHPEFEVVEGGDESIHFNRITPIYRLTEGISQRVLRGTVYGVLESLDPATLHDRLPRELDAMPYGDALRQIHFPDSAETREAARKHLVLGEFFAMQLFVGAKRAETVSRPGKNHCGPGKTMEQFHAGLPFPLTGAQKRTIAEIRADLAAARPMNRLLHGDVGSGKTLVALSAMLLCVESGAQAALMAPTQILAEQHYLHCKRWLEPLGINIALRTGSKKIDEEPDLFNPGKKGGAQIIIGTHALLYEGAGLTNLGLAVIDEQHKFGVLQRAKLIEQATAPDVLVMTATPIPRTLTMTVYGDLDVSTLDEMPADRGKIVTALRDTTKLPDATAFLRKELEAGRQAYIVYPLIEESDKLEAKAAAQEFEKWRTLLAPLQCELLHGRVDAAEKDALMEKFRSGKAKALIATSVIEVGIDVPNATVMLIENAERFGLAQLHQLRGRIGRGAHKSYCILISDATDAVALEKLNTLAETSDGFKIAEADLRLRGPGDILGTAQSGLPPLKLGNLLADQAWMRAAREAAIQLFKTDPALARPEHRPYRDLITSQRKLMLSQIS
ncbi:MAG TPA: ATP-dependent DNA helicase RecG [Chthoniobacteraceae bacterium]|jgi:ATP-dependent DNA helicase RecG|nr:ATP-dependent DNA helicase RecG [Chthoniobacteraceae bacterium]